jgi:SAM-dependent methyltransferase
MPEAADRIIEIYRRHAAAFDRDRSKALMERPYLEAIEREVGRNASILDLGCGSGEPIAKYFIERGHHVTGVDTSDAMLALCRRRFPEQTWLAGDMRTIELPQQFDAVIAWDSFSHLTHTDQRLMFARFAAWVRPGGVLLFTSGPEEGEVVGQLYGEPLFHASLSHDEYRRLLIANGLTVLSLIVEDPACGGHTVWLARLSC